MSKATEEELASLHGVIARELKTVILDGTTVMVKGEPTKVTASAAYFMAGLTMLKLNNITADPTSNAELSDLTKALAQRRKAAKERMNVQDILKAAEDLDPAGYSPHLQ
jgi:hypothetical protein